MSEQEGGAQKRSRRVYIYWGIALTLLISAALFCWLVVVPVLATREAVLDYSYACGLTDPEPQDSPPWEAISELGGPERTARRLALYLTLPDWIAPEKPYVPRFVRWCEEPAVPVLRLALGHENPRVREQAAESLWRMCQSHQHVDLEAAVPELERAAQDKDPQVRETAARALEYMGYGPAPRN